MGNKKKILIASRRKRMDIYRGFKVEGDHISSDYTGYYNRSDASFGVTFPDGIGHKVKSGCIFVEIYELLDEPDPGPGGIGVD